MVNEHGSQKLNTFGDKVRIFPLDHSAADGYNQPYERHVLVCSDKRAEGCYPKGAKEVQKAFQSAVIADPIDDIKVSSVNSMGFCDRGPVSVVYPDGIWYEELSPEKARIITEEHLKGGNPVEEFRFDPGLPPDFKHVIVCVFLANCAQANGGKLARFLKSHAKGTRSVQVTMSNGCLKECSMGPVCVVYPQGEWYTGVKEAQYGNLWQAIETGQPSIHQTGEMASEED